MVMRTTKSKIQNEQIRSMQDRTAEITPLLSSFFDYASSEEIEETLFNVFDEYMHPAREHSSLEAVNSLFAIRSIVYLVSRLEIINNQLKGDLSC